MFPSLIILWLVLVCQCLYTMSVEYKQWSFQQELRLPSAGATYARTPYAVFGRGFISLISGYDSVSPGGVYIHTTDDGFLRQDGMVAWTLHGKLVPKDPTGSYPQPSNSFGQWMCTLPQTLIISSPYYTTSVFTSEQGAVYIFNGTNRYWTQIQRLISSDADGKEHFGKLMKAERNRLLISAEGFKDNIGAVYVYDRDPNTLMWSRQSKLVAIDSAPGSHFGRSISLSGSTAVIGSLSDDYGVQRSGSAYFFMKFNNAWSQQQKLVSVDAEFSYRPLMDPEKWALSRPKFFANTVAHVNNSILVSLKTLTNFTIRNRESIYVFKHGSGEYLNTWSLQQKLFMNNESGTPEINSDGYERYREAQLTLFNDTLMANIYGPDISAAYVFKSTDGSGSWTQHQRLTSPMTDNNGNPLLNFSLPSLNSGTLVFSGANDALIMTQFHERSCLRIYLSDQFLDGWDIAVLTVRAPDTTEDRFHPHCDQVNPFYIRYCPARPEDEGAYIVKVFSATRARYFWEISWQVLLESTGQWFKGDFASKMIFHFNSDLVQFEYQNSENILDLWAPCYRCTTIDTNNWATLQKAGAASFIKLVVRGAPYFISDTDGLLLFSSGRVCYEVEDYQCYVSIPAGTYTLRLAYGTFHGEGSASAVDDRIAPSWKACGLSGGIHQQLIFNVANSICTPIQLFNYTSRCTFTTNVFTTKFGVFKSHFKNVYSEVNSRVNEDGTIQPVAKQGSSSLTTFRHHLNGTNQHEVDPTTNSDQNSHRHSIRDNELSESGVASRSPKPSSSEKQAGQESSYSSRMTIVSGPAAAIKADTKPKESGGAYRPPSELLNFPLSGSDDDNSRGRRLTSDSTSSNKNALKVTNSAARDRRKALFPHLNYRINEPQRENAFVF